MPHEGAQSVARAVPPSESVCLLRIASADDVSEAFGPA